MLIEIPFLRSDVPARHTNELSRICVLVEMVFEVWFVPVSTVEENSHYLTISVGPHLRSATKARSVIVETGITCAFVFERNACVWISSQNWFLRHCRFCGTKKYQESVNARFCKSFLISVQCKLVVSECSARARCHPCSVVSDRSWRETAADGK